MDLTQKDYDERIARRDNGQATDEDLRLIGHYEDEGFSSRDDSTGKKLGADDTNRTVDAPTANKPETAAATQPGEVKPAKQTSAGRGQSAQH